MSGSMLLVSDGHTAALSLVAVWLRAPSSTTLGSQLRAFAPDGAGAAPLGTKRFPDVPFSPQDSRACFPARLQGSEAWALRLPF